MEFDFVKLLILLAVLFFLTLVGSTVFKKFGIPGLVGEILIGIVVANVIIGNFSLTESLGLEKALDGRYWGTNWDILSTIAELGVIFLLFLVGLETKVRDLTAVGKTAFIVALLGVIIPFVFGFLIITFYDGNLYHALFMGAAMVATSVGITACVIKEMHLMGTKEAKIIIGAAVIDDILGLIVLSVVKGMSESGGSIDIMAILAVVVVAVLFVGAAIAFAAFAMPPITDYFERKESQWTKANKNCTPPLLMIGVAICVCLAMAAFAAGLGLAAIIGAFLAGMIFADIAHRYKLEPKIDSICALLLPFFFVWVGLQVRLSSMATVGVLVLAIVVILLALVSKYIGCGLGALLCDKEKCKSSANIIGVGMMPRGEVGIIVATVGYSTLGVLSADLFAVIVFMAVITTIIAPFLLAPAFKKKYPTCPIDSNKQ